MLHYCRVSLLLHLSVIVVLVLLGETNEMQSNLRELTPQSRIIIDNKIKNSVFVFVVTWIADEEFLNSLRSLRNSSSAMTERGKADSYYYAMIGR
ncbi:MAG: hypothetical protein LBG48_05670 [Rickettsiales bacterium]|jgi:hypothetical protein|nr:hypothetical protein [Rickettsiales bacterium]